MTDTAKGPRLTAKQLATLGRLLLLLAESPTVDDADDREAIGRTRRVVEREVQLQIAELCGEVPRG